MKIKTQTQMINGKKRVIITRLSSGVADTLEESNTPRLTLLEIDCAKKLQALVSMKNLENKHVESQGISNEMNNLMNELDSALNEIKRINKENQILKLQLQKVIQKCGVLSENDLFVIEKAHTQAHNTLA